MRQGEKVRKVVGGEAVTRSRENSKGRKDCSEEYGTDSKGRGRMALPEVNELKDIMANCSNCRMKLSQFATRKQPHSADWSTQTSQKPFLIDLIEERVEEICCKNARLTRQLEDKEDELAERLQELGDIEEKFTNILLSLAQEACFLRQREGEAAAIGRTMQCDPDTPAYAKALQLDTNE